MQPSPDTARKATLLDCCEELFQYVMRVNRSSKLDQSTHPPATTVRADITAILDRAHRDAAADPTVSRAFELIRLPLIFFADSMLLTGGWSGAAQWKPIQYDYNERGGDDKFWELFDETLQRADEGADQALEAFYTMIGLGFTGSYEGMHDVLRQKMNQAWMRMQKSRADAGERKLCPDAYKNVRSESLTLNPTGSLLRTAILVLVGVVTLLGATRAAVKSSRQEVRAITETLSQQTTATENEQR